MPAARVVSTLSPERLRSFDYIDISRKIAPTLTLPVCPRLRLRYSFKKSPGWLAFPADTRGFLYYYTPPKAPPLAGEVRFRLASGPDRFHDGEDLLSTDKIPWSISLFAMANRPNYVPLGEHLQMEGVVSPATLGKWAQNKLPRHSGLRRDHNPVLYYLRQPFFLRFNALFVGVYTVTQRQIDFYAVNHFLMDHQRRTLPYGGSGLVRFEPYKKRLALRVLKIIEPVQDLVNDYDGLIDRPTEGALIQRSRDSSGKPEPVVAVRRSEACMSMLPVDFEDLL